LTSFSLGPYVIEVPLNRVRRNGQIVQLEPKIMQVLLCLAERHGQVVSKQELIRSVWPDTFVSDDVLTRSISVLRKALDDDSRQPRFIETIQRSGYRLIGPISSATEVTAAKEDGRPVSSSSDKGGPGATEQAAVVPKREPVPDHGRAGGRRFSTVQLLAVAVGLSIALAFAAWRVWPRIPQRTSIASIRSLAVLPLENLSGDPSQEYFADGMTDELITMLAKNSGLRIISRTSVMRYQRVKRPLPDIARELGVDGILEGSAGRFGSRVHINVQLIYAPTDTHVWAESYDRDASDVVSLQGVLAQTIAQQVGLTASAWSHPSKRINPEAHDAYLMGRYYWFAGDFDKSREYFQKAIGLQPDYAAAWSGIADSYIATAVTGDSATAEAVANGEPAALKALALDESAAETHITMAAVYYFLHWDLANADRESGRAIEINPRLALAHDVRSQVLLTLERPDEALQQAREVMELDPFARPDALARALIHARKFDAAITEARLRTNAQSDNVQLHDMLRSAYMHKGMEKEAAEEWEAELQLSGDKEAALAVHQAFIRGGLNAVHEWELSGFVKKARNGYVAKLDLAAAYAHLRRKAETLHYLELAYQEREPLLVTVQNMPSFDFLHSEPRYQAIVNKIGLPAEQ
jgi:TolB-like protein/DNA-binding winged helix-turn-helix (wHTH) protein